MSVVLMYHALYRQEDTSLIDDEDLPYAVSEQNFKEQLDAIAASTSGVFDGTGTPDVVLTFDDGHASNLEIALPLMAERHLSGYFFITTGFIGQRRGFLSAADVKTLAESPFAIVGSHGVTHRFFDDMNDSVAKQELLDSRQRIEQITGKACQSMSFPGGRYTKQTLGMMQHTGYTQWFGSTIGIINPDNVPLSSDSSPGTLQGLANMRSTAPLHRIAVRRTTQLDEFRQMIGPDTRYYTSHRRRALAKTLLRRAIGNRLYHGLYKSLSTR